MILRSGQTSKILCSAQSSVNFGWPDIPDSGDNRVQAFLHKIQELFFIDLCGFRRGPRPVQTAGFIPVIQQNESVPHPQECLDSVRAAPAEEKQRAPVERIQMIPVPYDLCKAVDSLPEINGPAAENHFSDSEVALKHRPHLPGSSGSDLLMRNYTARRRNRRL